MAERYIPNHTSASLKEADPHQQLVLCLEQLVKGYPPLTYYSKHELHGLYSGPTSIAYLFLHLSHTHPDLIIASHHAKSWCEAYIAAEERRVSGVTAENCGVINEELAFCAVSAALDGDSKCIDSLAHHAAKVIKIPDGSDEWLYGRAGLLYLLRLVRHWVPGSKEAMDSSIKKVGDRILEDGPRWRWHGKEYLGAVHGYVGIITQLVLSDPSYSAHPKVVSTLKDLLKMQDPETGNFPSSSGSGKDHLVQFCHGAPGFALSLPLIRPYFDTSVQQAIDDAMEKARACIWKFGLLTKEPNLCHGASANALALASPEREHFMAYTTADMIAKGRKEGWYHSGSDPYGLFCGEAGRAWAWAVLDAGSDMGIIGYSDV
ncbi:MAG: hypothetical protein LQ338_005548 [Usnochroma carphineum]|nr:MAG: hypothetical protein LQ338_005548 [Usnochroma carphineum]